MIVGLVGFAYFTGAGALGFELAYLVATLFLLTMFARKVWRMSRERRWVSPGEMLGDLYGSRRLALIASTLFLVALVPYASAQLKGIGEAVAGLAGGSWEAYVLGVVFAALVIAAWTWIAGMWSVAVTDAFQGLWMLGAATGLLAWLLWWGYGFSAEKLGEAIALLGEEGLLSVGDGFWKLPVFIAFTAPWIFFAVTNPQVVQRLYVPRDEEALKKMVLGFTVFGYIYTLMMVAIGLLAKGLALQGALPQAKAIDQVTPTLLAMAPAWLSAAVFTSIVAAAVSTADSILLTLASCASRDIAPGRRWIGPLALALCLAAMTLVAMARIGFIVQLSVLSSVLLLPLAPVTIAAWIAPSRVKGAGLAAEAAIVAGAAIGFAAAAIYGAKKAFTALILGVPVSVWVLLASTAIILLGLAFPKK